MLAEPSPAALLRGPLEAVGLGGVASSVATVPGVVVSAVVLMVVGELVPKSIPLAARAPTALPLGPPLVVLTQALKPEGAEEDLGGDAEAVAQAGGHGEGQGLREGGADVGGAEHDGKFVALLVDVCGTAAEVKAVAGGRARELTVEATALHAQMPAEVAAVVERAWWSAKVIDSESPSCLLPIKPRWSTELFDVPAMLLPRSHVLDISREYVYYRSSGCRGESVPARLLWCVSGGGAHMDGRMVVGSSRLDEVLIDAPDALFPKFEHLGAYGRQSDARRPWGWPLDPDLGHVEGTQPSNWTNNKPQADDLGFHHGAGDENRTRALGLGSCDHLRLVRALAWANILGVAASGRAASP